jgi:hypothetical protein
VKWKFTVAEIIVKEELPYLIQNMFWQFHQMSWHPMKQLLLLNALFCCDAEGVQTGMVKQHVALLMPETSFPFFSIK